MPVAPARMRFKRARFVYDATGMRPLKRVIRRTRPLGTEVLNWCEDLLEALSLLAQAGVPHTILILDPRFVFVTKNKRLRFARAPLEDEKSLERYTPLALLESWCEAMNRGKRCPYDVFVEQRLEEYIQSEGETLSLNRFRSFVQDCRRARNHPGERLGLVLTFEDSSRSPIWLKEGATYLVGRGTWCDVCVADQPKVSRRHLTLRCQRDVVVVTDLGSTNGTMANGRPLRSFEPTVVPLGRRFVLAGILTCRVVEKGA